jgi:hypothetical protein
MIERMMPPAKLMLETPLTRRDIPRGGDTEDLPEASGWRGQPERDRPYRAWRHPLGASTDPLESRACSASAQCQRPDPPLQGQRARALSGGTHRAPESGPARYPAGSKGLKPTTRRFERCLAAPPRASAGRRPARVSGVRFPGGRPSGLSLDHRGGPCPPHSALSERGLRVRT